MSIELRFSQNSRKRTFLLVAGWMLGAFLAVVILFLMLPTLLLLASGSELLSWKKVYSIKSPDERYVMEIYRRVALPVDSLIDPSAKVAVTVTDKQSSIMVASKEFSIHEYPELTEPSLMWYSDYVRISRIEWHREIEFDLPLR